MPQVIEVPGHGQVEFPDGMSDDQIVSAIKANAPRQIPEASMRPEANIRPLGINLGTVSGEMESGFNPAAAIIKAGGALTALNRGVLQARHGPADWLRQKMGMQPSGISAALEQAAEEDKQPLQDLQTVNPGSTLLGDMTVAAGAPWRALPVIAASEYGSPAERATRAGVTFLGGKLAQKGGEVATKLFAKSEANAAQSAAANAVKDTAIQEAKDLGYTTVPSISNGSLTGRVIEGATGSAKARQLAEARNQPLTDSLLRKAFDLPEGAPITYETMKAVRAKAATAGYDPVRQVPRMNTDDTFRAAADKLTSRADNASKDFGDLVQSDIKPLADKLKSIKTFTGDTAIDAIAIFREKASDLYAKGDKTLGKAYREAAEAIEDQIDRSLSKSTSESMALFDRLMGQGRAAPPPSLVKDYRAARARMAQTFDAEKALREGQGSIDAKALGRIYAKNPDRMTGELKQIGKAAAAMPEVMGMPKPGATNPISALDSGLASFGGILAGNPAPLLYPAARVAGRYGLLSGLGQKTMTKPTYRPSALLGSMSGLLDNPMAPYASGLLGYEATR